MNTVGSRLFRQRRCDIPGSRVTSNRKASRQTNKPVDPDSYPSVPGYIILGNGLSGADRSMEIPNG